METILIIVLILVILGILLSLVLKLSKQEGYLKAISEKEGEKKEIFGRIEGLENLFLEFQRSLRGDLSSIVEISRDMKTKSEELLKFFEIMQKAPGTKGGFGEIIMEDIVKKVLPSGTYEFQKRRLENRPDCIIRIGEKIVPVDAKFPITVYEKLIKEGKEGEQEFKRSIKKHIENVRKYIRPELNTYDFALIFIPSEAIYSTVLSMGEIMELAIKHRVFFVSPTTFYVYLSSILLGFKGLEIEKNAQKIMQNIKGIEFQLQRVIREYEKVETHIKNSFYATPRVRTELEKLERIIKEMGELKNEKS